MPEPLDENAVYRQSPTNIRIGDQDYELKGKKASFPSMVLGRRFEIALAHSRSEQILGPVIVFGVRLPHLFRPFRSDSLLRKSHVTTPDERKTLFDKYMKAEDINWFAVIIYPGQLVSLSEGELLARTFTMHHKLNRLYRLCGVKKRDVARVGVYDWRKPEENNQSIRFAKECVVHLSEKYMDHTVRDTIGCKLQNPRKWNIETALPDELATKRYLYYCLLNPDALEHKHIRKCHPYWKRLQEPGELDKLRIELNEAKIIEHRAPDKPCFYVWNAVTYRCRTGFYVRGIGYRKIKRQY